MSKNNTENLTELFKNLGFNSSEVRKLVFSYNRYKDNYNTLEELRENYKSFYNNMKSLGYTDDKIHFLASTHPKSMFQKFKDGKLEEYYQEYLSIEHPVKGNLSIEERTEQNREVLINLGIDKEKANCILKTNLPLTEMDPVDLKSNIIFYRSCGISDDNLINMIKNNSTVLLFGAKEYGILLKKFGIITREELGRMIIFYSKNNTVVQPDCLYKTLSFASSKLLDYIKLNKWLRRNIVKNLDEDELTEAFNNLIKIGFSEEQAHFAASEDLSILYKQKEKLEYIIEVGSMYAVSKEKMIAILSGFPSLADLKEEKVREKIAVMTRYNLTDYVVSYPKSLIEGAELIDARASYLRLFHPKVDGTEFASNVFSQESAFTKKYNRENQYLKDLMKLLKK